MLSFTYSQAFLTTEQDLNEIITRNSDSHSVLHTLHASLTLLPRLKTHTLHICAISFVFKSLVIILHNKILPVLYFLQCHIRIPPLSNSKELIRLNMNNRNTENYIR